MNYTFKDVVRCINRWMPNINELNKWSRITYIAFLAQYDIRKRLIFKRAVKYIHNGEPISKTRFYIGKLLVIESDIDEIKDEDAAGEYNMPPQVEERIKMIANMYGNYKNWQIAMEIRRMLNLTVEKWHDYLGTDVDRYLAAEGFKIINKEI
jgi:hypothetical protein